ncbi:hypothetical protein COF68_06155 [Bacillus toyonensis]|uniref:hypothetical protein n=1 Tax=Bacillus toyonensis TaxID=155322 RepID=UPI000BFCF095|nr:hypothetical protein [Bacillus toyonensis]PHE64416.1 hypothetical protein COF68_06155 [Bacillus toyonensis]
MATEKDIVLQLALSNNYFIRELVKMPKDDGSSDISQVKHICRNGISYIPQVNLSTQMQVSPTKGQTVHCKLWNCYFCGKTYFSSEKEEFHISAQGQQHSQQNMNMGMQGVYYPQSQGVGHPQQQQSMGYLQQNQQYQQQQGMNQQYQNPINGQGHWYR